MKYLISLEGIWVQCIAFAIFHMIARTEHQNPYIAAAFVIFGLMRLEDSLKKDLTS